MTQRRGDQQELKIADSLVAELVRKSRWDRATLECRQCKHLTVYLEGGLASHNVKKLMRALMEMARFLPPRGNTLFDNAEVRHFEKVPTVAVATPDVVFRIPLVDNFSQSILLDHALTAVFRKQIGGSPTRNTTFIAAWSVL
jgi:hypothetical protein